MSENNEGVSFLTLLKQVHDLSPEDVSTTSVNFIIDDEAKLLLQHHEDGSPVRLTWQFPEGDDIGIGGITLTMSPDRLEDLIVKLQRLAKAAEEAGE